MGWSRCSCKFCIFGGPDQFASAGYVSPVIFKEILYYEKIFNYTLKRDMNLAAFIKERMIYKDITPRRVKLVTSKVHNYHIFFKPTQKWPLLAGVYKGGKCGS